MKGFKENIEYNELAKPNSKDIELLKSNFPNYFDNEGNFLIDKFKKMLENNEVNAIKESYELNFLGKSYARYLSALETETFVSPNKEHNEKEENKNSQNAYIIGDNLDALKHMLGSYSNKIKCIYIDPPYNTGNDDFVYEDKFKFTEEKLQEILGVDEDEAKRILDLNGKSSHSAWLTFMYPRLILARQLLSDDGVIFISINNNEQANLKLLCDDVFGESNFVTQISWECLDTIKNDAKYFSDNNEYILCYAKNIEKLVIQGIKKGEKQEKTFLSEVGDRMPPKTFWGFSEFGSTRQSNKELSELIGKGIFQNSKPSKLIKTIIDIIKIDNNDIILDFFSGSATTAHAVMQLNAEDGGNRKYIMVQLPEECKKDSTAYKEGYKTIDEIGIERIKRAAKKIKEETNANIDYGFKIYSLKEINENAIDKIKEFKTEGIAENYLINSFDTENKNGVENILATYLLADGYGLNANIEEYRLNNYITHKVEDSLYLINAEISSNDIAQLIKDIESLKLDIKRVVVFMYVVTFSAIHELRKNLSNLRNNKHIELIERY